MCYNIFAVMKILPPLLATFLLSLLVAVPFTFAQEQQVAEDEEVAFTEHLASRDACLTEYQFGSVFVSFDRTAARERVAAGDRLSINGVVENTNSYPLPSGRLIARVLRHDTGVADDNWHPVIEELDVPGDFDLLANGKKNFDFIWPVPTGAPSGVYRVEFSFLAGGRYSMGGLPFVPNFTAGSRLFLVENRGEAQYVEFDRSSVELNDAPYALRSVPPVFLPGQPLVITADVVNPSVTQQVVTVSSELHEWSDTDREDPVIANSQQLTLAPGATETLSFTWDAPTSGVYELVQDVTPAKTDVMPSLLKVRFPVQGVTPRIMFSGVTDTSDNEVDVTTCVINGTSGEGGGSFTTEIKSGDATLATIEESVIAGAISTGKGHVTVDSGNEDLTLVMTARDSEGNITDSHTVSYDGTLLPMLLGNLAQASGDTEDQMASTEQPQTRLLIMALGVIAVVVIVAIIVLMVRGRNKDENDLGGPGQSNSSGTIRL